MRFDKELTNSADIVKMINDARIKLIDIDLGELTKKEFHSWLKNECEEINFDYNEALKMLHL